MERPPTFLLRPLPAALEPLATLALDLRWTWNHAGDVLWRRVNPDIWDRTRNPWVTLQESSQLRLDQMAQDPAFQDEQQRLQAEHQQYLDDPAWYGQVHMMREYVEGLYLPAASAFRRRSGQGAQLAQELQTWGIVAALPRLA